MHDFYQESRKGFPGSNLQKSKYEIRFVCELTFPLHLLWRKTAEDTKMEKNMNALQLKYSNFL